MDAENGIPLDIIIRVLKRIQQKRGKKRLLRVSRTGIWSVRHAKTFRGHNSDFVAEYLTPQELKQIERSRETEGDSLTIED